MKNLINRIKILIATIMDALKGGPSVYEEPPTYVRTEGYMPVRENWKQVKNYVVGDKEYARFEYMRPTGIIEVRYFVREGLTTRPVGSNEDIPSGPLDK